MRLPPNHYDVLVVVGPDLAPLLLHLLLAQAVAVEPQPVLVVLLADESVISLLPLGGHCLAVVVEEELVDSEVDVIAEPLPHVGDVLHELQHRMNRQVVFSGRLLPEVYCLLLLAAVCGVRLLSLEVDSDQLPLRLDQVEGLDLVVVEVLAPQQLVGAVEKRLVVLEYVFVPERHPVLRAVQHIRVLLQEVIAVRIVFAVDPVVICLKDELICGTVIIIFIVFSNIKLKFLIILSIFF